MVDLKQLKGISAKWPQMVVTGKKLTKEQAKEVLIKTDTFFTSYFPGGNDIAYDQELRKRLDMPPVKDWGVDQEHYKEIYFQNEKWQKTHNCLELEHFYNNWISSCYVGGPCGWCHIDGTIHSARNIGKWPSWEEVYNDLQQLGQEFPFLDIYVYVMSCESCSGWGDDDYERECLGGLHLCNGKIELTTPIDPFSEVCKDELRFAGFDDIDQSLKEEVASVVSPIENSYFTSRCPNEHIFKIEEALEYFGKL